MSGKNICQKTCRALMFPWVLLFIVPSILLVLAGVIAWCLEWLGKHGRSPFGGIFSQGWVRFNSCMDDASDWWGHQMFCRFWGDDKRNCKICGARPAEERAA